VNITKPLSPSKAQAPHLPQPTNHTPHHYTHTPSPSLLARLCISRRHSLPLRTQSLLLRPACKRTAVSGFPFPRLHSSSCGAGACFPS
jgi:hypothetical protein